MNKKKVNHLTIIITALSRGGAEIQLLYLVNELTNAYKSIELVFFDEEPSSGTLVHEFNKVPNVFVTNCSFSFRKPFQTCFDFCKQVARIVNTHENSIIYTLMVRSDLYGKLLHSATIHKSILIQSFHAAYDISAHRVFASKIAYIAMYMWGYRGPSKKIFISKSVKKSVISRYPFLINHPSQIVLYGLPSRILSDKRNFENKLTELPSKYILMVGRLDPDKNYMEALTIYESLRMRLKERCPQLLIIGQDDYQMQSTYNFSHIKGVEYLGSLPNEFVLEYMRNASIFYFCSLNEGLGLALLEALSQECIVLARNSGAFPELIEHGVNGYLYDPDNITNAVDLTIDILSMDSKEKKKLTKNALARLNKNHDMASYANNILKAFACK